MVFQWRIKKDVNFVIRESFIYIYKCDKNIKTKVCFNNRFFFTEFYLKLLL